MRQYGITLAILASLSCSGAAHAAPAVLFNTFGPGDTYANGGTHFGDLGPGPGYDPWYVDRGHPFRFSGTESYNLATIDVGATLFSGNNVLYVWLMSDVGGKPGAMIESFTLTGAMGPFGPVNYPPAVATSVLLPVLAPETPYWVVLSAPPGTDAIWNTAIDISQSLPVAGRSNNGPWWGGYGVASASPEAFRVTGTPITTPVVIPAPAAILLGMTGAGLVTWLRRRRAL